MDMTLPDIERNQFNRSIDDLVARVVASVPISREWTSECIKAANLCKQVAEFDPQLASELLLSGVMLTYTAGVAVLKNR